MRKPDTLFYITESDELYCIMIQCEDGNDSVIKPGLSKRDAEILLKIIDDAISWWFEI